MLPVQLVIDNRKIDQIDVQVQNFLDRGDWKAAIIFLERHIKKKPSLRLKVNKSLICMVSGDTNKSFEGLHLLSTLVETKSITDLDMISAINQSVPRFILEHKPELIENLWKYASKAYPKDAKLMEAWYDSCCDRTNFIQASIVSSNSISCQEITSDRVL